MHGEVYGGKCESDKRERIAQPYSTQNISLGESNKREQVAQTYSTQNIALGELDKRVQVAQTHNTYKQTGTMHKVKQTKESKYYYKHVTLTTQQSHSTYHTVTQTQSESNKRGDSYV